MGFIESLLIAKSMSGKKSFNSQNSKGKVIFGWIVLALLTVLFIGIILIGLITGNLELVFMGLLGIGSFAFLVYIGPKFQNPRNYSIIFDPENLTDYIYIGYKGKQVFVDIIIGSDGKYAFADDVKKTNCVRYMDNSKMGIITKYRVVNYAAFYFRELGVLSDDVKVTYN